MAAYYSEWDPFAAAWLRELIKGGHIAEGEVDERSIVEVLPADLAGFTQCHFFAGIGVWSHALRSAGFADDRPVWTGSCPCQPFSAAGQAQGFTDSRHLWPEFFRLIRQCRPRLVVGEQVASKDGLKWLDLVQADLEGAGYACAAVDLCAAGIGAPHIRQRLYWGARRLEDAELPAQPRQQHLGGQGLREQEAMRPAGAGVAYGLEPGQDAGLLQGQAAAGGLADAGYMRGRDGTKSTEPQLHAPAGRSNAMGGLADAAGEGPQGQRQPGSAGHYHGEGERLVVGGKNGQPGGLADDRADAAHGGWQNVDWLFCRDGKWRPVEPGTFPLAHGVAARVGRLRGYGNAICAPVAQVFIETVMEVVD